MLEPKEVRCVKSKRGIGDRGIVIHDADAERQCMKPACNKLALPPKFSLRQVKQECHPLVRGGLDELYLWPFLLLGRPRLGLLLYDMGDSREWPQRA